MPPLKPLVRGVRMASVMTTSSAFFWVLLTVSGPQTQTDLVGKAAYIADSPLLLGLRWLRIELSLSVAMMDECRSNQKTGDGINVKEREGKEEKLNEDVGKSVTK